MALPVLSNEDLCGECGGTRLVDGEPCPECAGDPSTGDWSRLYSRDGTPCATCSCSFQTLRATPGTAFGFELGGGLTLRVCTKGREPLVAESGTDKLWCADYTPFRLPLSADEQELMFRECSQGFLGDLAQGERPLPRGVPDLRWYDRGLREGWLPPFRVELDRASQIVRGPWDRFQVVGVLDAPAAGAAPALVRPVLQARGEHTYLVLEDAGGEQVVGRAEPHPWWVAQVALGSAVPLDQPMTARRAFRLVALKSERRLLPHHVLYADVGSVVVELDRIAATAAQQARAARARGDATMAEGLTRRGELALAALHGVRT